jgi:hypothetical protein
MTAMNPVARQFFADNPDAKYFYANPNARIVNPTFWRDPFFEPDPWPAHQELAS